MGKIDGKGERKNEGKEPVHLLPLSYLRWRYKYGVVTDIIREFGTWFLEDTSSDGPIDYHLKCILSRLKNESDIDAMEITAVLKEGAKKYDERNWEKGMNWSICYASGLRHLMKACAEGDDALDEESGLPHLAHAACNVMFLLEYCETYPEGDDRPRNKE